MRSTLGLTGPVRAQKSPAERRAIWVQYRGKSAAGHKTVRYVFAQPSHTENTPAASFVLLNAILLTRAPEGLPPRLQPTFSWACPQWRTFVPALPYLLGFAAGAMLYVVAVELLPTAARGGALSAAVGFTVMMVLDVALG